MAPTAVEEVDERGPISAQDVLKQQDGGFPMDEAVKEVLLSLGMTYVSVAYGEHGGVMLRGEFDSVNEIFRLMLGFILEPYSYGRYQEANTATYFYLCLARWQDRWAVFFGLLLRGVCQLDAETNGQWPEFDIALQQLVDKVIPRLLGHLTHDSQPIKPTIIHGDLWEPNLGTNMETGELVMYDVGSYYAHNEMDLGQWRADFCSSLRSPVYTRAYLRYYPAAEPVEEFDDRNRLYSLKGTINYSAGHPGCIVRQTAYNNMCYLCETYAPIAGIDKYDPQKDPSVTGARLVPTFTKPPTDQVAMSA
ncbi:Fructosamine kinase-domain-containing protein [Coniochaeta sp. 2T2.1]|nr:Fructosamine kinase-domain-containing protein [Coniochaeta sp. 2T2.1]